MKNQVRSFIICLLIAIAFLLGMFACPHVEQKSDTMKTDSLQILKKVNKDLIAQNALLNLKAEELKETIDSLDSVRKDVIHKWESTIPDAISVVDSSNCDSLSKRQIKAAIDTMKLAMRSVIATDSIEISNLKILVKTQDQELVNDSLIMANNEKEKDILNNLLKDSKKALRRQKIKTVVVGTVGAVATILTAYLTLSR